MMRSGAKKANGNLFVSCVIPSVTSVLQLTLKVEH